MVRVGSIGWVADYRWLPIFLLTAELAAYQGHIPDFVPRPACDRHDMDWPPSSNPVVASSSNCQSSYGSEYLDPVRIIGSSTNWTIILTFRQEAEVSRGCPYRGGQILAPRPVSAGPRSVVLSESYPKVKAPSFLAQPSCANLADAEHSSIRAGATDRQGAVILFGQPKTGPGKDLDYIRTASGPLRCYRRCKTKRFLSRPGSLASCTPLKSKAQRRN